MTIGEYIASNGWQSLVQSDNAAIIAHDDFPVGYRIVYHTTTGWSSSTFKRDWIYNTRNDEKLVAVCVANEANSLTAIREILSNFRAMLISHH